MNVMKLSWGTKIAIVYGGFVVLMVSLVVASMNQDFHLVTKDYYQQELKYQEVIDAGKNQAALSAPVSIQVNESSVSFQLPDEFRGKSVRGSVAFYAAADSRWDAAFDIHAENNSFQIPADALHPTYYKIKIKWEAEGKQYYQESELNPFPDYTIMTL